MTKIKAYRKARVMKCWSTDSMNNKIQKLHHVPDFNIFRIFNRRGIHKPSNGINYQKNKVQTELFFTFCIS